MNLRLSFLVPGNWKQRAPRLRARPPAHRPPLALEALEDRSVPSAVPALGHLPAAPALGSLSSMASPLSAAHLPAIASPMPAPLASAAPAAASPAASGASLSSAIQS